MDIHKPKAAHSWREFLIEIGTIVCGILIALGLEQVAEQLHWSHKVHEAEKAMRAELTEDDGPQAYARLVAVACYDAQLAALQAQASKGMDRQAFHKAAIAYSPPNRTWDQQAWQSAIAADIGTHVGAEQMQKWSAAYSLIPGMQIGADQELKNRDLLPALRDLPGRLSEAETDRVVERIATLRGINTHLAASSLALLQFMRQAGLVVPPATRAAIIRQARVAYGSCARDPDASHRSGLRLDDFGQFDAGGAVREALDLPPLS